MNLFLEAGMGARVGKVDMNRNCPKALCESVEEAVSDNETLIAEYAKPNALVSPIITPRFVPSCTPELLQACGDLARKYNLPVQSHLSENRNEIAWVKELEPESRMAMHTAATVCSAIRPLSWHTVYGQMVTNCA